MSLLDQICEYRNKRVRCAKVDSDESHSSPSLNENFLSFSSRLTPFKSRAPPQIGKISCGIRHLLFFDKKCIDENQNVVDIQHHDL